MSMIFYPRHEGQTAIQPYIRELNVRLRLGVDSFWPCADKAGRRLNARLGRYRDF
jgi:hypothetical protein